MLLNCILFSCLSYYGGGLWGHFALDEHSFNYVFLWIFLVLSLSLYYAIYLETDLEEGKIPTGKGRASGYSCLPCCRDVVLESSPYLALVGDGLMLGVVGAAGT